MPIQDYCPYCNQMITIPDGLAEFTCPYCQTLLEFDLPEEAAPQVLEEQPQQEAAPSQTQRAKSVRKRTTSSKKIRITRKSGSGHREERQSTASKHIPRRRATSTRNPAVDEPPPRKEVLLGKTKTGSIPQQKPTPPDPVLNFVDEDERKRTKNRMSSEQAALNFLNADHKTPGATTQMNLSPDKPQPTPPPVDTNSNIKIATPVDIDNVTGLLATRAMPAPDQVVPEEPEAPAQASIPSVRIVGSSTEFKIEKDTASKPVPPNKLRVDTQEKTRVDMKSLLDESIDDIVPTIADAVDQELVRATNEAHLEAERARRELEEAKRQTEEEKRRLEELRATAEEEERQRRQKELQREREELERQQAELKRMAEEAKRAAEELKAEREREEALKAERAREEAIQRAREEAVQRAKEEAIQRAKEQAIAQAKERLIEEKKQQMIEEAKRKVAAQQGPAEEPAQSPKNKTVAGKPRKSGIDLSRKKKKKRPLNVKGGKIKKSDRRGEAPGDKE